MKNKIKQNEKKYDWLEFAQSFLLLAKLGCQELSDYRDKKHSKTTRFDPPEFNLPYTYQDLFVSIVFNIKHGVEVFIKTLTIILGIKPEYIHDLKNLFNHFKNILPKNFEPINDGRGNEITKEDIEKLPNDLDELEKLIIKYYHCEFLEKDKKVVNIYDEMNDIFRYPENNAKVKIDLNVIDDNLIKTIHEDIDKIYRLFNDLGYFVDVAKNFGL